MEASDFGSTDRPARSRASPLLFVALALGLTAAVFLVLARITPRHTDGYAYFAALLDNESSAAAFYANLRRYQTLKWIYADIGYASAAWTAAVLALTMLVRRCGWRPLVTTTNDAPAVIGLTLLACGLMLAGVLGQGQQLLGREVVYDGSAVPMIFDQLSAMLVMGLATLVFLAFNLAALARKPVAGQNLFPVRTGWRGALISLIYAPFLLLPAYLLIASFLGPGGWGMSTGAVIAIWLVLNSRALAIGPATM